MPILFIHATNSTFDSRDNGDEYDRPEAAMTVGIQSALGIAVDEMQDGRASSAVEIRIELEDGTAVLRSVVAVSVSPLQTAGEALAHSA